MTQLDVCFRYGVPPGESEVRALSNAREVYGIRKISFDEKERTIHIEYDTTRLNNDIVTEILHRANLDLKEKVELAI